MKDLALTVLIVFSYVFVAISWYRVGLGRNELDQAELRAHREHAKVCEQRRAQSRTRVLDLRAAAGHTRMLHHRRPNLPVPLDQRRPRRQHPQRPNLKGQP